MVVFGIMLYRVMALNDHLQVQLAALKEQSLQEDSYYRLLRLIEETTEDRVRLHQFFLKRESDSIDFLNQVEALAPESGVVLVTDSLNTIRGENNTVSWIQASFSFSGTRHNVQNFIQILETLPYVQRLTSVKMAARSSSDWQANVTMQVRVLAYDE